MTTQQPHESSVGARRPHRRGRLPQGARDPVRDRSGELRDLMVLAHSVERQWSAMATAGIVDSP